MKIKLDENGNIKTNSDFSTSAEGVFAAGDADTGASLVARAISNAKLAAMSIHNYIDKNKKY